MLTKCVPEGRIDVVGVNEGIVLNVVGNVGRVGWAGSGMGTN